MAHTPSVLLTNRGPKYVDQWNEKHEQPDFHSVGHQVLTGIPQPPPQNDGYLNKPLHQRSDQNNISIKSYNSSNERKCQVYVHQFSKIPSKSSNSYMQSNWRSGSEIHQNLYKHEFSDFYDTKVRTFRKQFDNLSLNSRKPQISNQHRAPVRNQKNDYYNATVKVPYVKPSPNSKINKALLFKPEHKAAVDKLEETYWAKWKPSKTPPAKETYPKMKGLYTEKESYPRVKGLYTENEKLKSPYHIVTKSGREERGDSNEAIMPQTVEKHESSDNSLVYVENTESEDVQQKEEHRQPTDEEGLPTADQRQDKEDTTLTSGVIPIIVSCESESECNVNGLKHTDSFILTTKKQSQEKPHYQQPKCIKLFKNAGYTTNTPTNYVKSGVRGGSYPLKSCLKKDSPSPKLSHLGRPGSPVRGSIAHRPGKANRFTK